MKRIIVILTCLAAICLGMYGCGPRTEIVKRNALEKIDSLLGSMDVQREEIKQSMQSLKQMITGIKKSEIQTQVKLEEIKRDIQPIQDRVDRSETSLAKLKDYLEAGEAVTLAGKEYSPTDLDDMAGKILQERKNAITELGGLEKAKQSVENVLNSMKARRLDYETKISRLEAKISEIDSQMVAVKAMKDASADFGNSNLTLEENVNDLEDKIDKLLAGVRVEMLSEDERWDSEAVDQKMDSVNELINATQDQSSNLDEINKILGDGDDQE